MTRRSSVRAQARRIYCDSKQEKPATTPLPNPPPQGGREQTEGCGETSLTAHVRALYEDSAVPVREIAAIAGVTERTIYKYAAKQRWRKRYARAPDFVPVRGAGSRFIRRADKAKPIATGLKATDPAGAQRAQAACGEAEHLSSEAQADAQEQQRVEARIQAMDWTCRASEQLRHYLEARDKRHGLQREKQQTKGPLWRPAPHNHKLLDRRVDPVERVYRLMLSMAMDRWEALLAKGEAD